MHSTLSRPTSHPHKDAKDGLCVAVVGATGAVGEALLKVLAERDFPLGELRPLASARSVGRSIDYRGKKWPVRETTPDQFEGADLVFFAATGGLSATLAPAAVEAGAVVIDKSSTWRMHDDVPLVVPEINAAALEGHRGIIANPNCTTTGVVMAVEGIRRQAGLSALVITTFQAVSGSGRAGLTELSDQLQAGASGETVKPQVFAAPIAHNVVAQCGTLLDSGYTDEEMKLVNEARKILALPTLNVAVTCVRVPVPVGHSASLLVETTRPITPEEASACLASFPGVSVAEHKQDEALALPSPREIAGSDTIRVGRIRRDLHSDRLALWQVGDNLRKGAATNAVQIAEALLERDLLRRTVDGIPAL